MVVTNDSTKDKDNVAAETCFSVHAKYRVGCTRSKCRYWFDSGAHHNCVMLATNDGPRTLEEVGGLFDLTRMRICQIEGGIRKKLKVITAE